MAEDFETIPFSRFRTALLVSPVAFGAPHGLDCRNARGGGSWGTLIAHATTNAMLAVYAIVWSQWQLR